MRRSPVPRVRLPLAAAVFLLLLAPAVAHAASGSIGAVFGVNKAGISGDAPPNVEYGGKTGLIAGLHGELEVADGVFVALQPMFVQRGASLEVPAELSASGAGSIDLDYLAVPVLLKVAAANGRTYVSGGVDVAFLQTAEFVSDDATVDVEQSFESTDIAALIGFGVVFPLGWSRLAIEGRYVQGLINLGGDSGGPIENLPDRFRSSGMQFTAGFLFPLGRQ